MDLGSLIMETEAWGRIFTAGQCSPINFVGLIENPTSSRMKHAEEVGQGHVNKVSNCGVGQTIVMNNPA